MKWLVFFVLWSVSISAFAIDVIDDTGQKIFLKKPATRIISLAPDLTENLFAIGAGDSIVGVIQGSDYPEGAKKIPVVGSVIGVDEEKILALHPDLILVWDESHLGDRLKKLGVPIFFSHPKKIADIASLLNRLGKLTGHEKKAEAVSALFLKKNELLIKKYAGQKTFSVYYEVWSQPFITITKQSWINDAIEICGGKNIFADLKGVSPEINVEAVLYANPDVIISSEKKQDWKDFWKKWPELKAVQQNHLHAVDADLLERATPRVLEGMQEMCLALRK